MALAARSALQIAQSAARDIHPPAYYLLLAVWTRATGTEIVALRGLSAFIGVAVVAGVIGLGSFLWRRAAGLAAGTSAAVSPYLVWYSQEVRSYILVAALVTVLVYLAVAFTRRPRDAVWWISVVAVTSATLYTHYFAGLVAVLSANAAFVVGALYNKPLARHSLPRWAASQVAAILLFLPWLVYARESILAWPATSEPLATSTIAREALVLLSGGSGPRLVTLAALVVVWGLLGMVALRRGVTGANTGAIPLAVAASGPVGLAILGLARPAWNAKFLVSSAPGVEILVGAGLAAPALWLAQRRPGRARSGAALALFAACAATVVAPRWRAMEALAHEATYARDDYRGLSVFIESVATGDDAVILNAPTQVEVYGYYDRGRIALYPLPESRPPDKEATLRALEGIAGRQGDLFAILWATRESDPDSLVENWLNESRAKALDRWFGNVRLAVFGSVGGLTDTGITARFGKEIALFRLSAPPADLPSLPAGEAAVLPGDSAPASASPERSIVATAGDVIALEAAWHPLVDVDTDYVVFAQLLDGSGQLVAGRDFAPVGGSAHTSEWDQSTGEIVDRIGLAVPVDLPAGTYTLILGLYDPATGARLPAEVESVPSGDGSEPVDVTVSDHIVVADVVVGSR